MTKDDFEDKMMEILERGAAEPEVNHGDADDLLCEMLIDLGYKDIIAIYHRISKWYA